MGTIAFLLLIVVAIFFFRGMLIRLVLMAIVAAVAHNAIMSQVRQTVSASVDSATSLPSQLMTIVQDKSNGFFGEGRKIGEKWRKCVEVSTIQQTAGLDMALQPNDPNQRGIRAIRECRQL